MHVRTALPLAIRACPPSRPSASPAFTSLASFPASNPSPHPLYSPPPLPHLSASPPCLTSPPPALPHIRCQPPRPHLPCLTSPASPAPPYIPCQPPLPHLPCLASPASPPLPCIPCQPPLPHLPRLTSLRHIPCLTPSIPHLPSSALSSGHDCDAAHGRHPPAAPHLLQEQQVHAVLPDHCGCLWCGQLQRGAAWEEGRVMLGAGQEEGGNTEGRTGRWEGGDAGKCMGGGVG